jgi:CheY-like chemotaxis protein
MNEDALEALTSLLPMAPRVVVADDSDDAREILVRALRRAGFEVVEARDGRELLATASELSQAGQPLDGVVADIDMPGPDGIEASRRLRHLMPAVPIVLITGLRDERTISRARSAGATAILQRPFESAELTAVLEELILPRRA